MPALLICYTVCSCSLNQCLDENKALTNRLIDAALQHDDDLFDAAFAHPHDEPQPKAEKQKPARAAPDPAHEAEASQKRKEAESAKKRQEEMAQQVTEYHIQSV